MKFCNDEKGLTLIEVLIVIAIVAIVAATAVTGFNSFQSYIQNNKLKAAARMIQGDFLEMKASATAANRVYRITFSSSTYTTSRCNNTGASCTSGAFTNLETKDVSVFGGGVGITAQTFGSNAQFETRGTVTNGTITLTNSRGSTAVITTSVAGKVYVQYTLQ
jgi:prepilin-type N-terminal cleavage/methylation domain-containing protein